MRLSSRENLLIVYWGFPAVGFVECCRSIDTILVIKHAAH